MRLTCSVFLNEPCDIPSLCVAEYLCFYVVNCKKESSLCPSGHNTLLTGGPEKQRGKDRGGWEQKGTDGWKRLKERIVRTGTDVGEKGDSSEEGNGGPREEGD